MIRNEMKMKIFKQYSNIKNFLERFTIIKIGRLHIRIHKLLDKDQSTLLHSHPFHYISIILKGGYTELYIDKHGRFHSKTYSLFSVIKRSATTFHIITQISAPTITLFIAYGNYGWDVINLDTKEDEDGIFKRLINGNIVYSKKKLGVWYIGNKDIEIAMKETRYSIHQTILPLGNL